MKLKKIAALALAGVMAVSMLAGCAGKGTTDDGKTDPTTSFTDSVVAKLSADTTKKVTFAKDNDLAAAVEALEAKYGTNGFASKLTPDELAKVDPDLSSSQALFYLTISGAAAPSEADVEKAEKGTSGTWVAKSTAGVSAEYAAQELATKIDTVVSGAQTQSDPWNGADKGIYRMNYATTGTITTGSTADPTTGAITYYAVYTLTATGTVEKF